MKNSMSYFTQLRKQGKLILYRINDNKYKKREYRKEILYRKSLPFTQIEQLSKSINVFSPHTREIHKPNDYYSHAFSLKNFLGASQNYQFKFAIEHGIALDSILANLEMESPFKFMVVASRLRAKVWEEKGYRTYCIGPYINYAKSLLEKNQQDEEKKRLGKCLVVFPTHSTPDISATYNIQEFCTTINERSKDYDSVRICLYWKDIQMGIDKIYKSYGFECVTAGHVLDCNFLPRLKSIIKSSQCTMSNSLGSYSCYSLFLKKPHHIVKQKLIVKGRRSEVEIIKQGRNASAYNNIFGMLNSKKITLTNNQKGLLNYYYGFDQIKTKKQLGKFVELTESSYRKRYD